MRFTILAAAAAAMIFTSGFAARATPLPVNAIDGQRLMFGDVTAQATSEGVEVSGWISRERSSYAPISAHLHIEALGADGATLETLETNWQGELATGIRHRRPALFRASLNASQPVAGVRVTIVDGAYAQ